MMFLVRSAFWLSIVYAHMPFDGGQVARVAGEAQGALIATAATAKCVQDAVSCRAILSAAASAVLSPSSERSSNVQPRARGAGVARSTRPSANSLSAADLATPWRGRPAKSGA